MKKIIVLLLSLFVLLCTGCTPKEEEKEPLYYSKDIRVVTKNLESLEDLKDKVLAVEQTFDKEYTDYVLEELNKKGIELTEDNLYVISSYAEIMPLIESNDIDAWVLPDNREDSVVDYRSDYRPEDYTTLATFNKPYYEEQVIDTTGYVDCLYNKPFAVMLNGLDCFGFESVHEWKNNNNDVNHLMVVNPEKKHVLIVSLPRDSYVYNPTNGYHDKLSHMCHDGPDNPAKAIGYLLDTKVPYYCLTSFNWFVYAINTFGGVKIDVPMNAHLDMDSERNVANPQDVKKGFQNVWGEAALALARNRKYNGITGGDFGRIRNQALIIDSLINKIATHPYLLKMVGMSWLWDYLCENNFTAEEKETLMALAQTFEDGYTIDNYFIEGYDATIDGIYFTRLDLDCIEVAKGKIQLVMNGSVEQDNPYYQDIMKGYVTGGAGTVDVGENGYIGEYYDLGEVFN